MSKKVTTEKRRTTKYPPLVIAPGRVLRGENCLTNSGKEIAHLGERPLIVGGDQSWLAVSTFLEPVLTTTRGILPITKFYI